MEENKIMVINKGNIDSFVSTDYKRGMRKSAITRLTNCLVSDGKFKNPIHVNKAKDHYRIIDGNHRIEAIKRFFEINPDKKIELNVVIHEGLTEEQERKLYDELAKIVNQTLSDYIKIHFDEVPFFQWIDNGISTESFPVPISIYSNRTAISYAGLLSLWEAREKTGYSGKLSKEDSLNYAKSLTKKDYEELKAFFQKYRSLFGLPATQNPYFSVHVIWVLESIYFRNKDLIGSDKIFELFKTKLFDSILILNCARASRSAFTNDTRRLVLEKLNTGWRGNKFV